MANGALSGYFEKQKEKADRVGPSPYASSAGATATAPAPTATPAPAAAPSAQKAGGTGFVNFGTYFGANAPAIQAQAQKAAGGGDGTLKAVGTAQGLPSQGQGGNVNFRPGTSLSSLGKGQSSIDQGIARTQAQMGNLAPAMTGDMGKGTSLFDQMLGGATTQQAAESRFKALEQQLGQQQSEKRRVEAETGAAASAAAQEQRYDAYLASGGSSKKYRDLSPDEKRWVQAAVDGTSFV